MKACSDLKSAFAKHEEAKGNLKAITDRWMPKTTIIRQVFKCTRFDPEAPTEIKATNDMMFTLRSGCLHVETS